MKRNTLLLLALLPLAVAAQKLTINKTSIDVGKTSFQVPVTATFELRNKSSKHMRITQMKTDCGCTTAEGPENIGPGERFTISLTYDAKMLGHFTKQVAIYSNATKVPVYLKMKGVVLEDAVDYSKRFPHDFNGLLASVDNVEFDDVNKGEHPEIEIGLVNDTEENMTPNLHHLPAYLTAVSVPERLEPKRSGKIILTLNSDLVGKYGLTQVPIYLARKLGEKANDKTEIPVSIVLLPDKKLFDGQNKDMAPRLSLSAESLNLDKHHKTGTITMTNNGKSQLNISSLQMFTGGVRVKVPKMNLMPGESAKMSVTIIPSQIKKARSKPRILMITNDPEHAKVVITINVE